MVYGGDFYKGRPALTAHEYGNGLACYVCTDAEQPFYDDLYRNLVRQRGIQPILEEIPAGLTVFSRTGKHFEYVFVQNFTGGVVPVRLPECVELLHGNYDGAVPGYSTVIFRRKV